MVPASASARRSTPASRNPAPGGHEGRGRWRWSPTGRTVRNRVRSYRRRGCHPTHRPRPPPRPPPPPRTSPRRGESSVGESLGTPAPRAPTFCPPCSRRGGTRGERVPSYDLAQDFEMVYDTRRTLKASGAILLERDGLRFRRKKKKEHGRLWLKMTDIRVQMASEVNAWATQNLESREYIENA